MKRIGLLAAIAVLLSAAHVRAAPGPEVNQLIESGLNYLKSQQKPDGGWQNEKDPPAITAIVLKGFVQEKPYTARTDFIRKGYEKLFTYQLDSGGIYKELMANYNTAIAVSAIAAAREPAFQPRLDRAVAFLKSMQWTDGSAGPKGEKVLDQSSDWYGGWGYDNHGRPDLSNAHFSIQALHDVGLKDDDPAFKAAIVFLSRTQNSSATNDQPWAGDDGGFIYSPANGGDSEAESFIGPDGRKVWRSYGSMTYAGLKSMIYAGLAKDDPRVKAALAWIQEHWTLDENPAMRDVNPAQAQHGLYYYLYVYAHALHALGEPIITDKQGRKHDWRAELIAKASQLQRPDGSWAGEKRWMEDNPVLVTAYVVLALEQAAEDRGGGGKRVGTADERR